MESVFARQWIFFIEKQGLAMRLGKVCGLAAVLVEQPAHFWDENPSGRYF
jgi:hypothetical protein